jgi:citrate lyase subunit beta / citryl-CoA lyase
VTLYEEKIVIVACAAGLDTGDGSFAVLRDIGGYRRDCMRAQTLGPSGRWALHPSRIEIANEVFSPLQEELDRARKLGNAYDEAEDKGLGAVKNDGDTIDAPSIRSLRNTIQSTEPMRM